MARPPVVEQERRERIFVRRLAESRSFVSALIQSGLDPGRAFRLLDTEPAFRAIALSVLLDGEEVAA